MQIVLGNGRCNPPTRGHWHLIRKVEKLSEEMGTRAEFFIIDGEQSGKDKQKNPLTPEQRVAILRGWFPSVHFDIAGSAYDVMEVLEVQNKIPTFMVACSDRAKKYKKLLDFAGFKAAAIVELDRESGDADGVSATKARAAAAAGDFDEFVRMMPSEVDINSLRESFDLVRKALNSDGAGLQELRDCSDQ